jgi:hypothetical protein
MTDSIVNLDRLPAPLRDPAQRYAALIREVTARRALALIFHGIALEGGFDPSTHTARNVLLVDQSDLEQLRALGSQGRRLGKAGIAAPVVMTPGFIQASLDTFPLELIEIQQRGVRVFGEDHFASLAFADDHVRMQCERELKVALVHLHQALITSGGRDSVLHGIIVDTAEGLVRVLRGVLWLRGVRETRPAGATLAEVENLVNRKLPGIGAALDPTLVHGWNTFRVLYDDVTALGGIVDAW